MIKQNIIANFVGRAWGVLSVYLFVPLYLKFLGMESYGLVGFYSMLIGVLAFADLGFSATLKREMARLSVRKGSSQEMNDILRTYELAYSLISLFLSVLIWFMAPLIAERWLRPEALAAGEITGAIRIMGIAVSLQMPSGLYVGGLVGLQKQVLANIIQILWGLIRGLGAVVVLWMLSPTIAAFMVWQLFANAVYCVAARHSLWRALSRQDIRPRFKWQVFRNTWRYAAGMLGMTGIATILTQTDKIVVSKMLSLQMLGYYSLAVAVASAPVMLASPIATAVFPRLTGYVATQDRISLSQLYHRTSELVGVVIIPAALTLAALSAKFIFAWTGSATVAQRAGLATGILLCGQIIQGVMIVPYNLALAHGDVSLNLKLGIVSVLIITPLLFLLIMKYGIVGAGISWLIMNLTTMLPYMYLLHRRFLDRQLKKWYVNTLIKPLLSAAPMVMLGYWLLPGTTSRFAIFGQIGAVWAFAAVVTVFASSGMKNELRQEFARVSGNLSRSRVKTSS